MQNNIVLHTVALALFGFKCLASFCKRIVIPEWKGELGYELLYWIPFVQHPRRGNFDEISVNSRLALRSIYQSRLGSLTNVLKFKSDLSATHPTKQISLVHKYFFASGSLVLEPAYLYNLVRMCRAGYVQPKTIFRFINFSPPKTSHKSVCVESDVTSFSTEKVATIWLYENDTMKSLTRKEKKRSLIMLWQGVLQG